MKRALLIVLGVLLLLGGLALSGAGAAVAALVGSDDAISTAPARANAAGVALVAEEISVDESNVPVPAGVGALSLQVTAPDHRAMFVGTASSADVDTYLSGAPYDVVVELTSGETAKTRRVPGTQQPPRPATQSFWIARAEGPKATLTAHLTPTTTVVVMNSDGSPAVTADIVATFTVPHAWVGSLVAAGVGLLLVVLAFVTFWRARAAGRRARASAAPAALAADTVLPGGAPERSASEGGSSTEPSTPEPTAPELTAPAPPTSEPDVEGESLAAPDDIPAGVVPVEPVIVEAVSPPAVPESVNVPAWAGSGGPDTLTGEEAWAPPVGGEASTTTTSAVAAAIVGEGVVGADEDVEETDEREPVGTDPDAAPGASATVSAAAQAGDDPLYAELSSWFREGNDDSGR